MQNSFFRKGPDNIPKSFTQATRSFKKKVILAFMGLIGFALIYFGLMIWFGYQSFNLLDMAIHGFEMNFFYAITGLCFAILSIFMFKSLIFINKREKGIYPEISKEDEAELVDFIHKVAEETGAPKPKKIVLSDRVNASVSYDVSFINILIPSKKNLEIGLGLMNVLNITEFKAVLAHEFGHFAQRSMLLGRYVYVAQQIAVRVINKRDLLDRGLATLSSIDLRVAWIGWILSILVWGIRSFIQVIFGVVVISERALSREMEFQADNVAVSVTGSDALIHGLHKLRAADEGYNAALEAVNKLINTGKSVPNMYLLQTNYIQRMRLILDDPSYGDQPKDARKRGDYRVFKNQLINPPEMWATHPSDLDRENNAKREYYPTDFDDRGAILLMANPKERFEEVTKSIIATANAETELISEEESIKFMNDSNYNWTFLDPKYKGVFLFRSPFSYYKNASEITEGTPPSDLKSAYGRLYPESIKTDLDWHRELIEEIGLLTNAMNSGGIDNKKIVHRGAEVARKKLPGIISKLQKEEEEVLEKLKQHDKDCRIVNHSAAKSIDSQTESYHQSLIDVLHFAEHSLNHLEDVNLKLQQTLFIILADGRVSDSEHITMQNSCGRMQKSMSRIYDSVLEIELNESISSTFGNESGSPFHEVFKFDTPSQSNLESWINNYSSWLGVIVDGLNKLRNGTLEQLLKLESEIQESVLNGAPARKVYPAIKVGFEYDRLIPGEEEELESKLRFWDKFHSGIGLFPTIMKFSAAAAIIALAIFVGRINPSFEVLINNGLAQDINVKVGGENYYLTPHSEKWITVSGDPNFVTTTVDGEEIEIFKAELDGRIRKYLYNVASSSYLYDYTIVYGGNSEPMSNSIGPKRWVAITYDYVMEDAPDQISSSSDNVTRSVINKVVNDPRYFVKVDDLTPDVKRMIASHIKWDEPSFEMSSLWLDYAPHLINGRALLDERLEKHPADISAHRAIQDYFASPSEKEELELSYDQWFARTNNPSFLYLKVRNMEGDAQDSSFVALYEEWNENPWLARGAAYTYAERKQWDLSLEAFQKASLDPENSKTLEDKVYKIQSIVNARGKRNSYINVLENSSIFFDHKIDEGDETAVGRDAMFYYYLQQGNLDEARKIYSGLPAEERNFADWYLAASIGATEQEITNALKKDIETSIHTENVSIALGLVAREGEDYLPLCNKLADIYGLDEASKITLKEFLENVLDNNFKDAKENLMRFESFEFMIDCELIACVIAGEKVPKEWRFEVEYLKFSRGKPYLTKLER